MFSSKFLRATRTLLSNGTQTHHIPLRFCSANPAKYDVAPCGGYLGQTGKTRCPKKVSPGCRTPNASVKCVSLSMEVPCEKIRPPLPSFLEMLQAQDVFKLQKSCPNECCCQTNYIPARHRVKISWDDIIHLKTRC